MRCSSRYDDVGGNLWDSAGKRHSSSNGDLNFKVGHTRTHAHTPLEGRVLTHATALPCTLTTSRRTQMLRKELQKGFRDTSKTALSSSREMGTVLSLKLIPETEVSLSELVRMGLLCWCWCCRNTRGVGSP